MKKAVEAFNAEQEKLTGRVEKLSKSIKDDTEALQKRESDYKLAVVHDEESESVKLFGEINTLKNRLAMNKSKHSVLSESNNIGTLEPLGHAVVAAADKAMTGLQVEADAKLDKFEARKAAMFDSLYELGEILGKADPVKRSVDRVTKVVPHIEKDYQGKFPMYEGYTKPIRYRHRVNQDIMNHELIVKIEDGKGGK